jgi:glycosyltransferase involved in cell wall biosynthesis
MRVAFIHNEKKIETGAHQINNLMSRKLKSRGVEVVNVYPKLQLVDPPVKLRGLSNILFFYSLLEQRDEILGCDLIQGTTYTPLTFLAFPIPVITHFGSTSYGFLRKTPRTKHLEKMYSDILKEMKAAEVIGELDLKTRKPIKDIADIETYVAQRADAVIATSEIVRNDLAKSGVPKSNVHVIHNAIEDFWFKDRSNRLAKPGVVFLGRLGNSVFDYKLKGVDRLLAMADEFPDVRFKLIGITQNKKLHPWLSRRYPNIDVSLNLAKLEIKRMLGRQFGNILYITSRYEGFSLSLIEGMSQGLVPIAFPVGVAPEIIKDGVNGFLVESHKQAVAAAKKILNSTKTRRRMALAAMQTAEKFSTDALADSLLELYREVLARPRVTKLPKSVWAKRVK